MSTTKALNLYWSNFKSFAKSNWKYGVAFGLGSLLTSISTLYFVKKLTGWSTLTMIFKYMIAKESVPYRKIKDVTGYKSFCHYPSPMRPSTELLAWDSFFRKQRTPKEEVMNGTVEGTISSMPKMRKQNLSLKSPRYGLPKFVPTPKEIIFSQTSVKNQGALKGSILTYPGAKIENGVIYYIHGGGFMMGYFFICILYTFYRK